MRAGALEHPASGIGILMTAQAVFPQYHAQLLVLAKLLRQSGVKMLAGSDAATGAPFVIPGISLHQEFRELANAGLSPLEILQMTTLNGAEFLGRQSAAFSTAFLPLRNVANRRTFPG